MEFASWTFLTVLFGCVFWTSGNPTITTSNNLDDGNFALNSTANITCKIYPYGFKQEWTVNSVSVAECGIITCFQNMSNPSTYSFDNDLTNGIFVFLIDPVRLSDNEAVIGCNNGSASDEFNLIVKDQTDDGTPMVKDCEVQCFIYFLFSVGVLFLAIFLLVYRIIKDDLEKRFVRYLFIGFEIILIICGVAAFSLNIETYMNEDEIKCKWFCLFGFIISAIGVLIILATCFSICQPKPPMNFRVCEKRTTDKSVTVKFDPGCDGGVKQTFTIMLQKSDTAGKWETHEKNIETREHIEKTIHGLESLKSYTIKVFAENKCLKSKAKDIEVKTHGKPEKPKNFQVCKDKITDKTITVAFEPGYDGGSSQVFVLLYTEDSDYWNQIEVSQNANQPAQSKTITSVIRQLHRSTKYKVKMFAQNVYGKSEETATLDIQTLGQPEKPVNFQVNKDKITEKTITVAFEPGYDGGSSQVFVLLYTEDSANWNQIEVNQNANQPAQSRTITSVIRQLHRSTKYKVKMFAQNVYGKSEETATLEIQTCGQPEKPKNFQVCKDKITEKTITVAFEPGYDGGSGQVFVLLYTEDSDHWNQIEVSQNANQPAQSRTITIVIRQLHRSTKYKVKMFAQNVYGKSEETATLEIQTCGQPEKPKNFQVCKDKITEKTITVAFEPGYDGGSGQIQTCGLRSDKKKGK